jgi:hypothetical protein
MRTKTMGRQALLLAFLVVMASLYIYGAVQQSRSRNQDWTRSDQSAYMGFARSMRESNYRYMGDWNRMPLYPALQSLLYRTGMSDEVFFVRGKWLNVILSIVVLASIYAVSRHYLAWHAATNLLLIAAFTLFVVKAPYFQSELLFYGLNFLAFVMTIEMLRRPTWRRALLTGTFWGLGHLVKASVLSGVALFMFWATLQALRTWRCRVHAGEADAHRVLLRPLLCIALAGVVFLAVIYPYISVSKRVFGHYFYNVNSTFYMWYDSWAEAKEGTRAYGDRLGWPDMPADQIPSLRKYVREHSARQMLERIVTGATRMLKDAAHTPKFAYGYFLYLVLFSLAGLVAALVTWRETWASFQRRPFLALYLISYFVAYALLYAWFMPIGRGNRFALGQFVPLLFVLSWFLAQPGIQELRIRVGNHGIRSVDLFHGLVSLALIPHIYFILTTVVRIADGGN